MIRAGNRTRRQSFSNVFVKHVSLSRHVASFTDGTLDLIQGQIVHGASGCDHVFLDHQAAHIVGAEEESQLPDLGALRDPRRLNVGNVVEKEPRNRLRAEIFEGASGGEIGHLVARLHRPADECREAARFVLQLAKPVEMFDTFDVSLDVAEHHRACRTTAELMPDPIDFEPLFRQRLVLGERFSNAVHQDFASTAGQAAKAGLFKPRKRFAQGQFVEFREVPDLRRAKCMQIDGGETGVQVAQQFFVPFEFQRRMHAALHEDLIAAQRDRLFNFFVQFFTRQDVRVRIVALSIEGAEIADRCANIGVVNVAIDVVRTEWFRMQARSYGMSRAAKGVEVLAVKKRDALDNTQAAVHQRLWTRSFES